MADAFMKARLVGGWSILRCTLLHNHENIKEPRIGRHKMGMTG
jgi:hypothetical protein